MTPLMEIRGLSRRFGGVTAVKALDLVVGEGELVSLIGPNGAGKTTTFNMISGLDRPDEGEILFAAQPLQRLPPEAIAARGLARTFQHGRVFANLSVEENLKVPLERAGPWTVQRIYQLFPRLDERRLNRGRQLSGGEQEMLSIGRALLLNPRLLILDEPSQGLAPLIVREVFRIVQQMKAEGISVLLVEQNARMSLEIADDAYVLDDGIVVYSGPARELAADEARVRALAGASAEEWTLS